MLNATPALTCRKLKNLRTRLEWIDRHAALLLPAYIALFFVVVLPMARRPLWYDELFTFYIANSKSADQFLARILYLDLNPPLSYLFASASMRLFGENPLAVRLPFILAFLAASLAVFEILRNRAGGLLGLTGMVLMWSCGFLRYASEARPYTLLLAFLGLALLCWMRIQPDMKFSVVHLGLSMSVAGMLLCHCFAIFFVAPFFLAEAVRSMRDKRIDRSTWTSLFLPMASVLLYIPLILRAQSMLFPPEFLPSWSKALAFYTRLLMSPGPFVWIPLTALLLFSVPGERLLGRHEVAYLATTLLMPLPIMLYLAWAHVAFWPRYGIGAVVAFSIAATCLVAKRTKRSLAVAGISALLATLSFCFQNGNSFRSYWQSPIIHSTLYREIHPDLPLVTASGLTFLEMDHREPVQFIRRLYYLTDTDSAIRYAHATIFEWLPRVQKYFPVRANVMSYYSFLASHQHFLVFATPDYPEDWLLEKLKVDGADIRIIVQINTSYRDKMLYEVTVSKPAALNP